MISPILLTVTGILLATAAGIPLFVAGNPARGQKIAAALHVVAATAGVSGAVLALAGSTVETWSIDWGIPFGPAEIAVDPLSALFLLPIFIISACCAVYAVSYWPAAENPDSAPKLTLFLAVLTSSLAAIVIARHAILFLAAWEIMTVSCYFAMTVDGRKKEVRDAGTLYLVVGHCGVLALFAFFSLLKGATASWLLPVAGSLPASSAAATGIFLAGLAGFGIKAGIVPLHIWLPSAHANAPSHISAIMSGVLIKMGIYGLIRTVSLFTSIPFWWGVLILAAGVVSGLIGVVFAIGQHDIKRLLAYHSIENIGIIAMGIGVSLMGTSRGIPALTLLGMAGALLHTLNHATFKSLLFFGAGSVIHACGTREIDRMGGLLRRMPLTAVFFLTGAVAICGLPPLNGFISEWLIYLGLFRGIIDADTFNDPYFALAAPALALIGGLAVACFVKVFGIAFLGAPRCDRTADAHEATPAMLAPMGVLAATCAIIGLLPQAVAPMLETVVRSLNPGLAATGTTLTEHASLGMASIVSLLLLLLLGGGTLLYCFRLAKSPRSAAETWGCGYLAPTARMQYTSSSFAATLVGLFSGILRPHTKTPLIQGHFPKPVSFRSHVPEALLEGVYLPLYSVLNNRLSLVRKLQHGRLHLYILYIVVTLIALLAWSHFRIRS
ncbi:MAG TPA: proton-conducting transporter membrane subunit [Geobacteraceae bacterium]|nr:proton-conducting transporter membrane subunit [Geobacteraceae bacterium]